MKKSPIDPIRYGANGKPISESSEVLQEILQENPNVVKLHKKKNSMLHTHDNGVEHSHKGGDEPHEHNEEED